MGDEFKRPQDGFDFSFLGMKLNSRPDTLPPGKYAIAVNVRAYSGNSVRTRPGQSSRFTTGVSPITDMRAYTALQVGTLVANPPRVLARDSVGGIYLDTGAFVAFVPGGANSPGVSMIPFRPAQSPTPYMYIADGFGYQKYSAPDGADVVTVQKAGIAEPQAAPDTALGPTIGIQFTGSSAIVYTNGGTAGASAPGARITDTVGTVLRDPILNTNTSVQVGTTVSYQNRQWLIVNAVQNFIVEDVLPGLTATFSISSIYYFTGTTGRCIIVPANFAEGPGGSDTSIYTQNIVATLRRGSLIKLSSGGEICFVWSVTQGPDGTISIETSTTGTHTAAETITSVPAIYLNGAIPVAGQAITQPTAAYQVTAGIGTQTGPVGVFNPFAGVGGISFQPEDYITLGLLIDDPTQLTEVKFLIDVDDGTFTKNFYYYTIRASDIENAIANASTQLASAQTVSQRAIIDAENAIISQQAGGLSTDSSAQVAPGAGQWTQIVIPLSSLTRVGNDQTKSLQTITNIQYLWNAIGTINVATDMPAVFGSGKPDVGDIGAPYLYRVRPRSSTTGVVGNPSPATRYGVSPRRQQVLVALPSAAYDSQIDTWDIFRYGGTVTQWRFIGSTLSSNPNFLDIYDDSAAQAGQPLDFDNFEPWPSVDVPNNGTTSIVNGTVAVVSTTNALITTYLPGTLVRLGGLNAYTLWTRPTALGGGNFLLQFVENAGASTIVPYQIQEPFIANRPCPYMWGPDANGTVFACGDTRRPGTLYFAKNYAPDSAPDTYNIEITPPSEPLMGGETIQGLSFVASPERWWALYPQPQDVRQRYSIVQQPFTRGLIAPWGHCTDGQVIYWWAKDGIYSSAKGSLTDADLYNLFPHEGVAGVAVTYNGKIAVPPDYKRTGSFRLAYSNGYLYATYKDSEPSYHTLVMDTRTGAWSVDVYSPKVSSFYHPEQPAGTIFATPTALYDELLMGNVGGVVATQVDGVNDLGGAIACAIAAAEFNGGDDRAPKQWGDFFMDLVPAAAAGVIVTPMSLGAAVAAPTTIVTSATRTRSPISVGGLVVSDFLGLMATWTDDYNAQSAITSLYLWQPSFTVQPAYTIAWETFGSSFGASGYMHIKEVVFAYVSTTPITLTITSYDGQSPQVITLPSTGGAYQKTLFTLTANKGQLYSFKASSASQFQIFLSDSEIRIGAWGRTGPYFIGKNFGDKTTAEAVI